MIEDARVVLLRRSAAGYDLLVVRRDGAARLPGGRIHDGEDARVGAARALFEDCGVVLARDVGQAETLEMPTFGALRRKVLDGANATQLLRSHGLTWASEALLPWSYWQMPAIDASLRAPVQPAVAAPSRTSTRIFIAELPGGMRTTFDKTESAAETWFAPAAAESLAPDLAFTPMLVRTCWELARHVTVRAVLEAAKKRASEQVPILPRLAARGDSRCLLLPWDPEYDSAGQGASHPFSYTPAWAIGPSRFVLEDRTWKHVAAPTSTRTV